MIGDTDDCIIKIRGLPWSSTVEEIVDFFGECNIKDLHLTKWENGRPSGEAYIELQSNSDLDEALKKNRKYMGHRYIEVFQTTRLEMDFVVKRCGLYANVIDEACVRLRGLPFECTESDVRTFFSGLEIVRNGITFILDDTGCKVGDAYVQFANKDMIEEALERHMQKIGHRYIEVFRSSLDELQSQTRPKMKSNMCTSYGRSVPYNRNERFSRIIVSTRPLLYHRGSIYYADQRVQFGSRELWNANSSAATTLKHTSNEILSSDMIELSDAYSKNCSTSNNNNETYNNNSNKINEKDTSDAVNKRNTSTNISYHYNCNNNNDFNYKVVDNIERTTSIKVTTDVLNSSRVIAKSSDSHSSSNDNTIRAKAVTEKKTSTDCSGVSCGTNILVDRMNLTNTKLNNRSVPYAKNKSCTNENSSNNIHMRGLPYKATIEDIVKFFKPFKPIKIHIICDKSGRSSGEADAEFATHEEALEAMIKDKQHMGNRYIELFLNVATQKNPRDKSDKCRKKSNENQISENNHTIERINVEKLCDKNQYSVKENAAGIQLPKITLLQRSPEISVPVNSAPTTDK